MAGKIVNSPASRTCARVVCKPIGHTHTGIINNTCELSDQARARAYARKRFHDEMVKAWLDRVFSKSLEDPVKVAVEEAVREFGSPADFTIWAWYANRIGVNSFLELYFEQQSVMRSSTLRKPASAFHQRLKRFYAAHQEGLHNSSFAKATEDRGGAR